MHSYVDFDRFPRTCERFCCSFVAAAQAYSLPTRNRLHFGRTEARKKLQVGSLTKIATACVVLIGQKGNPRSQCSGGHFAGGVSRTTENSIGFQPGDTISLRDLLYAALVQSDNVAAYMAYHAGSVLEAVEAGAIDTGGHVRRPDERTGEQLKMERTRFVNPHGIDWKVALPYHGGRHGALSPIRNEKPSSVFMCRKNAIHLTPRSTAELRASQHERAPRRRHRRREDRRPTRSGLLFDSHANRESEVVRNGQMETVSPALNGGAPWQHKPLRGRRSLMQRGWQLYDQWRLRVGWLIQRNCLISLLRNETRIVF
jgi:hypothetical protein